MIGIDTFSLLQTVETQAKTRVATIGNGSCVSGGQMALPGAIPGKPVLAGWASSLPDGIIGNLRVGQPDQINITFCNLSGIELKLDEMTISATMSIEASAASDDQTSLAIIDIAEAENSGAATLSYCYGFGDCRQAARRGISV